jgi:hypothetical protein
LLHEINPIFNPIYIALQSKIALDTLINQEFESVPQSFVDSEFALFFVTTTSFVIANIDNALCYVRSGLTRKDMLRNECSKFFNHKKIIKPFFVKKRFFKIV